MDRLIISSILRKLPLKLLLILLALFGVFMFCFSSAATISVPSLSRNGNINDTPFDDYLLYRRDHITYNGSNTISISNDYDFICMRVGSSNNSSCKFSLNESNWYSFADTSLGCLNTHTFYVQGTSCSFSAYFFKETDDIMPLPMTSLECQTNYNLIPISSVDQNYCVNNNLCPFEDCPEYPDNPNLGTSNIYINDVFHPGAFNVIVNIPEEIDWDYAYTSSGSNFNLDIVGYNQDQEMIQGWIDTNNYKPTSEDFTNIFTNFSNFGGLLIGALFVILVFYFIKKLFK